MLRAIMHLSLILWLSGHSATGPYVPQFVLLYCTVGTVSTFYIQHIEIYGNTYICGGFVQIVMASILLWQL